MSAKEHSDLAHRLTVALRLDVAPIAITFSNRRAMPAEPHAPVSTRARRSRADLATKK
jgi:hypothetical protein